MGVIIFIAWLVLISIYSDYFWFITMGAICVWVAVEVVISKIKEIIEIFEKSKKIDLYYPQITALENEKREFYKEMSEARARLAQENDDFKAQKAKDISMINELRKEKSKGYPLLAKAYDDYFKLLDMQNQNALRYKRHPAVRSAETIGEEAKKRRKAEYDSKTYKAKLEYLFELFPHLSEYIDIEEPEEELQIDPSYTEEEKQDPTTWYMTRSEWLKLQSAERNDRALKRYWQRRKTNIEIGKMYERYIGYLFEKGGCNVEYTGIFYGFEDLGRDLVATNEKDNKVFVIQCKCWAHYKKIHVAFINQLYGTVTQYRMRNKNKEVMPMFYATIGLDDTAREFAKYLNIEVKENFPMEDNYPCVKCNISRRSGEKIYHLPFDQQYDKTKIEEEKNEMYVATCKEAEDLGFRRAWKWHPEKGD